MDAGGDRGRNRLSRSRILLALAALAAILVSFYVWQSTRPGPLRLTRLSFGDLPGWQESDQSAALASFARGCAVLASRPPETAMGGKGYGGTAADWLKPCGAAQAGQSDARKFFEENFTPYRVSAGGARQGLFTGYYEPLIAGSRTRHDAFQTPVYGLPADLIRVDLSRFGANFQGEHIAGKLAGQSLVPYETRAEIDANGLASAKILFWCDDPVALFFLQIQGSGRVKFDDGSFARIAFAGENGRPYTAIGRVLIAQGALSRDNVSLSAIREWLAKNPARAKSVMEADQSFVFFEEKEIGDAALGSPGTLGVALTPLASLAIDPRLNVLGAPYYVDTPPVKVLLIGQDTGGAIRGAVRGDIFFGFGDKAERAAGGMKAEGTFAVLLPNGVAEKLSRQKDFP